MLTTIPNRRSEIASTVINNHDKGTHFLRRREKNLGWVCAFETNLTPINLLQKRIIKIRLSKPIDYATEHLLEEFKVFEISQIYYNGLLKFIHKNHIFYKLFTHKYITKGSDTFHTLNQNVLQLLHLIIAVTSVLEYIIN